MESALYSVEKVFPLVDSAQAQVHIVSSAEIHRGQSEHAVLDAIDQSFRGDRAHVTASQ